MSKNSFMRRVSIRLPAGLVRAIDLACGGDLPRSVFIDEVLRHNLLVVRAADEHRITIETRPTSGGPRPGSGRPPGPQDSGHFSITP